MTYSLSNEPAQYTGRNQVNTAGQTANLYHIE